MKIEVTNAIDRPSSSSIASFEQYCKIKLPYDFLQFIENNNGGCPKKDSFIHLGRERLIERLLPLMDDPNSDESQGQYDMAVVETQIGERLASDPDQIGCTLIPFATLFSGDFLCFDYRKNKEFPIVVLWDHNKSEEFAPHTEPVANSFLELISNLY